MSSALAPSDVSEIDPFCDEVLAEPYGYYAELRRTAAAVYLERHDVWAISRYEDVRRALRDWRTFSSAEGVFISEERNRERAGYNALLSDPPIHDQLRAILWEHLSPRALNGLAAGIARQADELVGRLVARGSFDGALDLAQAFSVTVVSDLVGLPPEGRERLLDWSGAVFNAHGPLNERHLEGYARVRELGQYLEALREPGRLAPGSWGAAIVAASERGEIRPESWAPSLNSFIVAGIDTTVSAIGSALWLFAQHPDQWRAVCRERSLIPNAFAEVMRLESPIQWFTRKLRAAHDFDGTLVPQGARAYLIYASANRDERKWDRAEEFDVRRDARASLAFGHGIHGCVGQALARLEGHAVLDALARRVERLELSSATRKLNNALRGFASLELTVHQASGAPQ